jgi:putative tryptophan/tyrosine transport system substrate-binding protein
MTRRDLGALLFAALLASRAAAAQQPAKVRRIGVLAPGPLRPIASFKERLRELGWIEGTNIRFEDRWAEIDDTRYGALAAELAALPVDAILTWSTPAVLAAKRATTVIPIVMGAVGDPVEIGAVSSLAHPGGNITGFSTQNLELEGKRFELLHELVPGLGRLVMLGSAANPYSALAMNRLRDLAEPAGLNFQGIEIDAAGGLESGLDEVRRARPDGVLVASVPALFPHRKPIVDFMEANRLPAVYPFREFAQAGGLVVYATNFDDLFRQAAAYVDKVLRGASPGDLPVQQAATFELLVNLSTAKALGLTIPPAILARADEVIE